MADVKVSDLSPADPWTGTEQMYLVQSGQDRSLSPTNLFASIPVLARFAGRFGFGPAAGHNIVTNTGTVDVTKTITRITNDQASVITLPAGSFDGQLKILLLTSASGVTTLAGTFGNASIRLTKAGDSAQLLWTQNAWWFVGGSASVT